MKYADAKRLVKAVGPAKYKGRKQNILQRLVEGLYKGPTDSQDIEGREVRKKTATVMGWVNLKNPTYLMDILRGIEEITAERHGKYLKYKINLEPLKNLKPPDPAKEIEEFKAKNAERMRKVYAAKREIRQAEEHKYIVQAFLKDVAAPKANSPELQNFVSRLMQEVK